LLHYLEAVAGAVDEEIVEEVMFTRQAPPV